MTRHAFTPEQRDRGRASYNAQQKEAADQMAERVVELTQKGKTTLGIAVRLGISERTVTRLRQRAGASLSGPVVPYPAEVWERAEEMLDDGASRAEVARTLGMNYSTVRYHFPDRGWTPEQRRAHAQQMRTMNRL